ncbi:MAG: ABC transporter ATP-binding protein [Clostridia bacterium]|nr:ABC transporter ATP-binding protein [Clostridia bacterium]
MLTLNQICKTFNPGTINEKIALNHLTLHIEKGDFITVIGGNGAGKSTLMNAITGVFQIDSGSIILDGEDITSLSEYKRAKFFGRVFQDPMTGTAPNMEIEENLALAYRRTKSHGLRWRISEKERILYKEALARLDLGLENRMHAMVGLLSGGQRQALTLLMATLERPKMLLLDEHTAALDPKTADKVLHLTDEIVREDQLTTLMVTHNMKNAIEYGNRLIMMHEGNVILDIRGEEKKKLTVEKLLAQFTHASGSEFANDRTLLS